MGNVMKRYILLFAAVFAAVLAAGYFSGVYRFSCTRSSNDHKHDGHDHSGHDHGGSGEGIKLDQEQRKHVRITVSKAGLSDFRRSITLHGEVKLNADRTARIMQRVPGFVTDVFAKQGDAVKKGTILARLTSEKLGGHYSDYYSCKALEEVAESEFRMAQKLYSNKAMAEKEFLRYKRDYIDAGIARRKAETILRSLELDPDHSSHKHAGTGKDIICTEYDVVSPISGTVIEKDISQGEKYADDNTQVLFTVSDLKRLWVELRADFYELQSVKNGMTVEITPLSRKDKKFIGKVIFVSSVVDGASRKGFIRAELGASADMLRSGEFALGRITIDSTDKCIVVPRDSVQLVSGEKVVFVPSGDSFITKVVKTGRAEGNKIEIVSGLSAGDSYVSEGAFDLKAVLLTAGMDPHAGHGH